MEKIVKIKSTAIPVRNDNIDTDQIIPARFLKATDKKGFGEKLFYDLRYDKDGQKKEEFPLNKYNGEILLAGKNFGSGSSREHAVWALTGYGIRAVVSSKFADIFRNNALNNGLLPVEVSESFLNSAFTAVNTNPETEIVIDLQVQTICIDSDKKECEHFEINPFKKECLLNGLDDLSFLLKLLPEIESFEKTKTLL